MKLRSFWFFPLIFCSLSAQATVYNFSHGPNAGAGDDVMICTAENMNDFHGQFKINLTKNEFFARRNSDPDEQWTLVYAKKTYCTYTPTEGNEGIHCPFQKIEVPGLYFQQDLRCDTSRGDGVGGLLTTGMFNYRKNIDVGHFQCMLKTELKYDVVLVDCKKL